MVDFSEALQKVVIYVFINLKSIQEDKLNLLLQIYNEFVILNFPEVANEEE